VLRCRGKGGGGAGAAGEPGTAGGAGAAGAAGEAGAVRRAVRVRRDGWCGVRRRGNPRGASSVTAPPLHFGVATVWKAAKPTGISCQELQSWAGASRCLPVPSERTQERVCAGRRGDDRVGHDSSPRTAANAESVGKYGNRRQFRGVDGVPRMAGDRARRVRSLPRRRRAGGRSSTTTQQYGIREGSRAVDATGEGAGGEGARTAGPTRETREAGSSRAARHCAGTDERARAPLSPRASGGARNCRGPSRPEDCVHSRRGRGR
jgi:hypothetical protein